MPVKTLSNGTLSFRIVSHKTLLPYGLGTLGQMLRNSIQLSDYMVIVFLF